MNKQELIKHIEKVKGDKPHYREQYHLGRWQTIESMLELIDQLDEPEITDPTISKKESVEKVEGDRMKKDKEWLREKVSEIVEFDLDHRFGAMSDKYVPLYELCNLIDQLDEPEITDPTLSKKETVE